ncbi:MAG: thiamine pyrophosphate-dependent enzyme [bacterium JZ-2024 1]
MNRQNTFIWKSVPEHELLSPGHLACQGCGAALGNRLVLKALGPNIVVTVPACCWSVIDGPFPFHAMRIPMYHTAFETAAITATGIRAGLDMLGKTDTTVVAWAGDGGTLDIGFAALSGAAERNENILYICYDNEAYMNTGIQRSGATPYGAWTTTTPEDRPNARPKKDVVFLMAAHRIPYLATASLAFPEDLTRKAQRARDTTGFRFLHLFAPCPPGWRAPPDSTVRLARLAVEARIFPLLEIANEGERWTLTYWSQGVPVRDYLTLQGRFGHLPDSEIDRIQTATDRRWEELVERHLRTHGTLENIPGYSSKTPSKHREPQLTA